MKPTSSGVNRCNGPCRKRFRSEIVTADRSVANTLPTSDPTGTGQFWFCPECRPPPADQFVDDREDFLPPELWLTIFGLLDGASIRQVRLTCPRWRELVDGTRALHEQFVVTFRSLTMDRAYEPENLPPGACFVMNTVQILDVDSWWPSFGAGLTTLGMHGCEIELATLLSMLKEAPNLKALILSDKIRSSVEVSTVDFQLKKLEYLRSYSVFDVFDPIFPRLTKLHVTPELEDFNEEAICRLMKSSQRTLKEVWSPLTPFMLDQIAGMSHLELEFVYQEEGQASAVRLSQMQRYITELHVAASNEELYEVGRNLPRLKGLEVTLRPSGTTLVPTFLAKMPMLTRLSIDANDEELIYGGFKSPLLKHLCLNSLHIEIDTLQNYLQNCAQVEWLTLGGCTLSSWSDFFTARFPPQLHCLELTGIVVQRSSSVLHNSYHFRELHFHFCNIPGEILAQLIMQCERLEKLRLVFVFTVSDETVAVVSELPLLKELTIISCPITDASVDLIIAKCGQLRRVNVSSESLSHGARKLMAEFGRTR